MITEVWNVDNEMINQIKSNTVMYHLQTFQYNILMFEINDKH